MNRLSRGLLVVVFFLLLLGCSAQTYEQTVEFDDPLSYSFDTLRYATSASRDITAMITDHELDLRLALRLAQEQALVESLPDAVDEIIVLLDRINAATGVSLKSLLAYSSSELLTVATANAIDLSIDDIVGFNDLKATLEGLSGTIRIDKARLIESLLDRELTIDETVGFVLFQEAYSDLVNDGGYFNLATTDSDSLRIELENLPLAPMEAEILAILDAFALLREIADARP